MVLPIFLLLVIVLQQYFSICYQTLQGLGFLLCINNRITHINYQEFQSQINPNQFSIYNDLENYTKRKLIQSSRLLVDCIKDNKTNCLRNTEKIYKHMDYYDRSLKQIFTDETIISPQRIPHIVKSIICIPLSPDQFAERIVLRQTRCHSSQLLNGMICLFFCGYDLSNSIVNEMIITEGRKYNDIVQFNFVNDYINLTTLQLSTFNWLIKNVPTLQYYIRTDSDVFLNVRHISQYILNERTNFTFGAYWDRAKPQRKPYQKWYMPYEYYPYNYYKPYHSGMLYIWSHDILDIMMNGINYVKPIHYIDDVYFGQILDYYNIELGKSASTFRTPLLINTSISKDWENVDAIHGYTPIELLCIHYFMNNITF